MTIGQMSEIIVLACMPLLAKTTQFATARRQLLELRRDLLECRGAASEGTDAHLVPAREVSTRGRCSYEEGSYQGGTARPFLIGHLPDMAHLVPRLVLTRLDVLPAQQPRTGSTPRSRPPHAAASSTPMWLNADWGDFAKDRDQLQAIVAIGHFSPRQFLP